MTREEIVALGGAENRTGVCTIEAVKVGGDGWVDPRRVSASWLHGWMMMMMKEMTKWLALQS